jgi:hypothetical protein
VWKNKCAGIVAKYLNWWFQLPDVTAIKLTLTSPTSGGRSVGTVRSRTQATEFSFSLV